MYWSCHIDEDVQNKYKVMISVDRDEILSRFVGIPAVL